MKKFLSLLAIATVLVFSSCKKPAGSGGNSTITGKVHVTNYNATYTVINSTFMAPDYDIYIIYGDDATYGDRVKTSPDGVYEFQYLRPGSYKIYVYSRDKDAFLAGNPSPPDKAVYLDIVISSKKQTVDAGTMEIIH